MAEVADGEEAAAEIEEEKEAIVEMDVDSTL